MSNALQWAPSIKAQGVVYNPTGAGKVAPIAPEDIAAVAAKLLVSPNGAEESPELTGEELLHLAGAGGDSCEGPRQAYSKRGCRPLRPRSKV